MNDDTISRRAAIDALRYAQHRFTVADEAGGMGTVKWSEDVIYFAAAERVLTELPPAQPEEAIPVAWIEEQAKCLESKDNAFAKIEANNIRVMIKKWRMEKDERSDFKTGGD